MPPRRGRRQRAREEPVVESSEGSVAPPYTGRQDPPPYSGGSPRPMDSPPRREEEGSENESEDDSEDRRSLLFEPAANISLSMPGQMPRTEPRVVTIPRTPSRESVHNRRDRSPARGASNERGEAPAPSRTYSNYRVISPMPQPTLTFGEFARPAEPIEEQRPSSPRENIFFKPSPTNPFSSKVYQPRSNFEPYPKPKPPARPESISSMWSQVQNGSRYAGELPRATEGTRSAEPSRAAFPNPTLGSRASNIIRPIPTAPLTPIHEDPSDTRIGNAAIPPLVREGQGNEGERFSVTLDALHKLGAPILDGVYVDSNRLEEVVLEIPTCLSTSTFSRGGSDGFAGTVGRYYNAIRYAEEALERNIPSGRHLICPEAKEFFAGEYAALDELLTHVWKYTTATGKKGYRIDTVRWMNLNTRLTEIRERTQEALLRAGEGVLAVPRWGPTGRVVDIWDLNDFEILSVGFRAETELFLNNVTKAVLAQPEPPKKPQSRSSASSSPTIGTSKQDKGKQPERAYSQTVHTAGDSGSRATIKTSEPRSQENGSASAIRFANSTQARLTSVDDTTNGTSQNRSNQVSNNPFMIPASTRGTFTESISSRPRSSITQNIYGSVRNESTSHRFQQMFQPLFPSRAQTSASQVRFDSGGLGPSDSSSSSSSDSDDENNHGGSKGNRRRSGNDRKKRKEARRDEDKHKDEPKFDTRLKVEMIPKWDGNLDTLGRWIIKLNSMALQSKRVCKQMGRLVPTRLEGSAERWYYSLHINVRVKLESDWETLRDAISQYYMNRTYMEKQKSRANKATYRDSANPKETPSEYFIRKMELLQLAYEYNDRELMHEILSGAPTHWSTILTPHIYFTIEEIQTAVKYHEDTLLQYDAPRATASTGSFPRSYNRNPFYQNYKAPQARTNLVGATDNLKTPQFPKDDTNVSKRGTPESKGGRPCRHCGSGKHWDYECRHSRRAERKARANFIELADDEIEAQQAYDDLYYGLESEEETDF